MWLCLAEALETTRTHNFWVNCSSAATTSGKSLFPDALLSCNPHWALAPGEEFPGVSSFSWFSPQASPVYSKLMPLGNPVIPFFCCSKVSQWYLLPCKLCRCWTLLASIWPQYLFFLIIAANQGFNTLITTHSLKIGQTTGLQEPLGVWTTHAHQCVMADKRHKRFFFFHIKTDI